MRRHKRTNPHAHTQTRMCTHMHTRKRIRARICTHAHALAGLNAHQDQAGVPYIFLHRVRTQNFQFMKFGFQGECGKVR